MSNKDNDPEKEKFISQLKKINWSEPDKVFSLIEPAIIFADSPSKSTVGSSKLGGQPDLPDNLNWPTVDNKPMVFFGQVNLSEIKDLDKENILPKNGILYFFTYFPNPDSEDEADYSFLTAKKQYKVLYSDGDNSQIKPRNFPDSLITTHRFPEMPIRFQLVYRIPVTNETWKYENAKLNEKDAELFDRFTEPSDNCDMILGTPNPIQYGVDYDWAFSYLGMTDYKNPQVKSKVDAIRPEFINLFSFQMIDRFDKIGIPNCYFGIRKQDLADKKFDNVVLVFQDT